MGTHRRVIGKSYLMNTSMTRFRWVSKPLHFSPMDASCFSTEKVNTSLSTLNSIMVSLRHDDSQTWRRGPYNIWIYYAGYTDICCQLVTIC